MGAGEIKRKEDSFRYHGDNIKHWKKKSGGRKKATVKKCPLMIKVCEMCV